MCMYSMQANRKFTIRSTAGAQQKKAIAKSSCQAELVQEVPRHREILRLLHKANTTNPTARKGTATLQIGMWFRRKTASCQSRVDSTLLWIMVAAHKIHWLTPETQQTLRAERPATGLSSTSSFSPKRTPEQTASNHGCISLTLGFKLAKNTGQLTIEHDSIVFNSNINPLIFAQSQP